MLWAACINSEDPLDDHGARPSLFSLLRGAFEISGVKFSDVVDAYFNFPYKLIPVMDRPQLFAERGFIRDSDEKDDGAFALLLLSMHLFAQPPCQHPNHPIGSGLYRTTRRLVFILETSDYDSAVNRVRAGVLVSSYECGHGMLEEAHATLAFCIGLANQLGGVSQAATQSGRWSKAKLDGVQKVALNVCWCGIILLDQ